VTPKLRLDAFLVETGLASNRTQARGLILAGRVRVAGQVADKPGRTVAGDAAVTVEPALEYASRAGYKLAHALDTFQTDVQGLVCADAGASTGGFTDCLLQRGAAHVFAIDVGYGQLAWPLQQHPRVTVLDRTNVRYLTNLPGDAHVDLVTIDVSFIGLGLILPVVRHWLAEPARGGIIALIKPQFEAGRSQVGKGGVIRDPHVHRAVLTQVLTQAMAEGLDVLGLTTSPITGPAGNVEFLTWLRPGPGTGDVTALVNACIPTPNP
jgi:23S rRNA (cytidine1920-2'-O)/16S rRNA (cytidine1409-2'-O)-methyltransferase